MTQWNLSIQEDSARMVHSFLARRGLSDLSAFVEDAVRNEILRHTADELRANGPKLNKERANEVAHELWAIEHSLESFRSGRPQPEANEALTRIAEEFQLKIE